MSYFVVWDGAIQEAFDTLEEATARVVQHTGARVIGTNGSPWGRPRNAWIRLAGPLTRSPR
jgi:hypothetical protein